MAIQLHGRWTLQITKAIHSWENRFRVADAAIGNGTYPPTVGLSLLADGAAWSLIAEYRENNAAPWKPSDMMIDPAPERVDILAVIGAEDPLPKRDFEDIRWEARYQGGTMLEVPYRPAAVRTTDLFQMPDGIFETSLGTYYMAVRVVNRWGLPFTADHVLDITPASRAALAARGIQVIDAWSAAELASLGQTQAGGGMVLGPLTPGAGRTLFFKIDVRDAAPRKHEVEFICWNRKCKRARCASTSGSSPSTGREPSADAAGCRPCPPAAPPATRRPVPRCGRHCGRSWKVATSIPAASCTCSPAAARAGTAHLAGNDRRTSHGMAASPMTPSSPSRPGSTSPSPRAIPTRANTAPSPFRIPGGRCCC